MEFLNNSGAFERIILPYVENLRAIGVDASLNTIDPAQYEERQEVFDYDIVSGRFVLPSTRPWNSASSSGQRRPPSPGPSTCPGSPTRPLTRSSKMSSPLPTVPRWKLASRRSTACCATGSSGSRTGTRAATGSPTGTSSAAPRPSRPTIAAPTSGGGMKARPTSSARRARRPRLTASQAASEGPPGRRRRLPHAPPRGTVRRC